MKTKRFVISALAVCLLSILTNNAMAFYNPQTGHWLNRDPLGEPGFEVLKRQSASPLAGGPNRYIFVRNDPIMKWDYLGLDNPGCDLPDDVRAKLKASGTLDCYLRCCATHDACFSKHGCTSKSWAGGAAQVVGAQSCPLICVVASLSPCVRCDDAVVSCFAKCKCGSGSSNGHTFFCPNGPSKGSWYDDYDSIPANCWEDGKKPTNPWN